MALYDTRLATWISAGVDRRMRLTAALNKTRYNQLVDSALDEILPSEAELSAQLQVVSTDDAR